MVGEVKKEMQTFGLGFASFETSDVGLSLLKLLFFKFCSLLIPNVHSLPKTFSLQNTISYFDCCKELPKYFTTRGIINDLRCSMVSQPSFW